MIFVTMNDERAATPLIFTPSAGREPAYRPAGEYRAGRTQMLCGDLHRFRCEQSVRELPARRCRNERPAPLQDYLGRHSTGVQSGNCLSLRGTLPRWRLAFRAGLLAVNNPAP